MHHRLLEWCRAAWQQKVAQSPGWQDARDAWRRAFCPRHVGAGATSLAIHFAAVLAVVFLSAHRVLNGAPPGVDAASTRAAQPLVLVGPPAQAVSPQVDRPAAKRILEPKDVGPSDVGVRMKLGAATLPFGDFDFDVAKLADRAAALFPFLTRRMTFELAAKPPRRSSRSLGNPYAEAPVETETVGPLLLSDAEVQRIVDQTWSRRERWTPFQRIRTLAETYHPDEGQVPALLRAYAEENVLQPYVESKMRDQRIWSQLALAADHAQFIEFVDRYAAAHPATKATMELLFLMDMLTEASLDTLLAVLGADLHRELQWTRKINPEAFQLLLEIQDFYQMQRLQRDLDSHKALLRHYDQIRIGILKSILRTSPDGYRESDARYLLGEIYWRQGRPSEARETWRGMHVDAGNTYVKNTTDILASIRDLDARRLEVKQLTAQNRASPDHDLPELDTRKINLILAAERNRWLEFSRERLRRFGYAPDAF